MKFLHPHILWFLLAVPVLVAAYVALLRRKKKDVIRYASLGLVKEAIGAGQRFRRHLPPLLFLLCEIALIVACAGPTAVLTLPAERKTIVLAMDVSLSMSARDVEPNRLTAAQTAAKAFVQDRPDDVDIGIVAFGATASLVQPPTRNRDDLLAAIDRFQLQRGTATGSALYVALQTLFPAAGIDLESLVFKGGLSPNGARGRSLESAPKTEKKPFKPVPPGSYTSGVIILLSDGRRTTGPDPLDAARMAADHGVRVYTVGFGTEQGGAIGYEGWSIFVRLDEETLKQVAEVTRAEYFYAGTSEDLKKVYQRLTTQFVLEKKDTEIAFLFAGVAAILLTLSLVLSLLWFSRL
ncbi:MAG: VWA domain-containing protein [Pseudomonadota bacterium]|nr:VWA domain-containing protein [Pseudomonadota bacterium]